MKVYFSASLYYREEFGKFYNEIIESLCKYKLTILDTQRFKYSSDYYDSHREYDTSTDLYRTMLNDVENADFCVFEASFPSTVNVGHEITVALERGKPTVVAYMKGKDPILFKGIRESKIIWVEYSDLKDLEVEMEEAICKAKECLDVRFNFFVTPKIIAFLNKVAKEKGIPRSVYIRELIEREMICQ